MRISTVSTAALAATLATQIAAFSVVKMEGRQRQATSILPIRKGFEPMAMSASVDSKTAGGFIETELRGQAMKLHTRSQAPKEGKVEDKKMEPYTPTRDDYLQFLVDSQHIYKALEDVVSDREELSVYRDTGLERVLPLETDIDFMVNEFGLTRPEVGKPGLEYAEEMRRLGKEGSIPELLCHYYNYYFAHTAGGRMIGKQMSSLLLDKKTLEFYKWNGDLNKIKEAVKIDIEEMVSHWSREEKDRCVNETAGAFKGGGSVNRYLSGGRSAH